MSLDSIRDLKHRIESGEIVHHQRAGYLDSLAARLLQGHISGEDSNSIEQAADLIQEYNRNGHYDGAVNKLRKISHVFRSAESEVPYQLPQYVMQHVYEGALEAGLDKRIILGLQRAIYDVYLGDQHQRLPQAAAEEARKVALRYDLGPDAVRKADEKLRKAA